MRDKAKGGNPNFQTILEPGGNMVLPPTLEDLGISKIQSSRWQLEAEQGELPF